jgi:hypothetical protein
MWPTSQLEDGTADPSPAMTAPGSPSMGSSAFPIFRAHPDPAEVSPEDYEGRQLVHGASGGEAEGGSWEDVRDRPWR